ncbi:transporter [Shewanella yunxiaonensis]|uniref:Transporter n=1 Tax=Shewanella yunxiaonensis TaxID=2829809 RepID=A0ABX7YY50_9GAMM|nr:transporter [Shewanella yunxiaonensis]QUN06986.1 transporter [Shewanella yunxiaonensis]
MKKSALKYALLSSALFVSGAMATEGGGGIYPNGAEGFLSGALPPPGLYLLQYVNHYSASKLADANGNALPINMKLDATATVNRMVYQTDIGVFGGQLGFYSLIPLAHASATSLVGSGTKSGLGDITVGPYVSWHFNKNWHAAAAVDFDMPTGEYNKNDFVNLGRNYWAFEPVFVVTYLADNGIEVSTKFMYDFNTKNDDTDYKSGNEFHIDYAAGYHYKQWTFGLSGYYYTQVTADSGSGATNGDYKGKVNGIGPSIKYDGSSGMSIELKYQNEFGAENKTEGEKLWAKIVVPL